MPTEKLVDYFMDQKINLDIDKQKFDRALTEASRVFL